MTTVLDEEDLKQWGHWSDETLLERYEAAKEHVARASPKLRHKTGASDKKEKVQAKQDPDLTATTLGLDTPLLEDNMASNNWVVHGDYTESGMPLLANDPHL
jgi:acyl-homoserine lactone acylase PvdQ